VSQPLAAIIQILTICRLVYSLATVETAPPPIAVVLGAAVTPLAGVKPRVRSVVHRSFLGLNPRKKETGACILQTTTDIRSAKSIQIHNGSPAEVLWWFPETEAQFRLQCRAFLLPALSHQWRKEFPTDLAGGREGAEPEVAWEAKRVECFNSLSSFLRASFARPSPGSELGDHPEKAKNWPKELPKLGEGSKEEREKVQAAFENFAVLYLEVEEVDLVDLGVIPNEHHRYVFRDEKWFKSTLVP
jgi:pyridoxamine 5'-phosphate oxidase